MVVRTGDIAQTHRIANLVQETQNRTRERQTDISTGKHADRFSDISDQASVLLRSKEHQAALGAFVQQNDMALSRLQVVDGAIGSITDQMIRMQTLLSQRLTDPTGDMMRLDTEAEIALYDTVEALNVKLGDRYLLAGSRTDAPPLVLPPTVSDSGDLVGVYQGDQVVTSIRADRTLDVEIDLNAGQFQGLIETLADIRAAHVADDTTALRGLADQLGEHIKSLAQQRGQTGATMARLEGIVESQRVSIDYLGQITSKIEDTDLPTAMAQLAQDRVTLEAAYLTISRLTNLSLADYLR